MSNYKIFSVPDSIEKSKSRNDTPANEIQHLSLEGVTRRWLLAASGTAIFLHSSHHLNSARANEHTTKAIPQPATPNDLAFVARAFKMRSLAINYGDQPYGAIIVRDGIIIGQSWSRVVLDRDPTGHAEMATIRDAARHIKNRDLNGAVLYSSSQPCPMCEAAAYWAGISRMIHGRKAVDAGPPQLCR